MSLRWKTYLFVGVMVVLVVLIAGFYNELISNTSNIEQPLYTQKAVETSAGLVPELTGQGNLANYNFAYPYPPPQAYTVPTLDPLPFLPDYSPYN